MQSKAGGEGGIRTPDTLSGMPVFKTGAINRSATSPRGNRPFALEANGVAVSFSVPWKAIRVAGFCAWINRSVWGNEQPIRVWEISVISQGFFAQKQQTSILRRLSMSKTWYYRALLVLVMLVAIAIGARASEDELSVSESNLFRPTLVRVRWDRNPIAEQFSVLTMPSMGWPLPAAVTAPASSIGSTCNRISTPVAHVQRSGFHWKWPRRSVSQGLLWRAAQIVVFYGTATFGGQNGNGTIFKATRSGAFAVLHTFSGLDENSHNEDGAFPLRSIVVRSNGNL
jgi:uncharacterized repeat protein (TIGR03803 family)